MNILLEDESASIELGRLLSDALQYGDEEKFEIHLEGNLGAGKSQSKQKHARASKSRQEQRFCCRVQRPRRVSRTPVDAFDRCGSRAAAHAIAADQERLD